MDCEGQGKLVKIEAKGEKAWEIQFWNMWRTTKKRNLPPKNDARRVMPIRT